MRNQIAFLFFLSAALRAQPIVTDVANGFTGKPPVSPGSLAFVRGTNLMIGTMAPIVTVGTKTAFVVTSSSMASQLFVELPVDAPVGATTLTVTAGGQTSVPINLTLAAYAPAVLTALNLGMGPGFFVDATKTISQISPANPGETLMGYATGLGPTNPLIPTGSLPAGSAPTTEPVTLTIGGESATVLYAGASNLEPGADQLSFVVPLDTNACTNTVVLTIAGVSSTPVFLPIAAPAPIVCAIENSATGLVRDAAHAVAPNSFLTVYAASVIPQTPASNLFPATDYQGVEVLFNGTPVPLYGIFDQSDSADAKLLINAMVPSELGITGSAVVTVNNRTGSSSSFTIGLASDDVGVFRLPDPATHGGNQGVVLLTGTYSFAMPASLATAYKLPSCSGLPVSVPCGQPAKPGDHIVIYLTGGGLATANADPNGKPVATGSAAPLDGSVIYRTVLKPTITIAGMPAVVDFSGIAPGTGSEYQINTTIPLGVQTSDAVPVAITMSNSTDTVTIAVKAQ